MPTNDIGIDRVTNYDMVRQNKQTTLNLQVTNYGVDIVNSFEVEAQKDGETFASKTVTNLGLSPNEMTRVEIPDMVFPQEGNTISMCVWLK